MKSIFVGIDVSKHSFTACALDTTANKLFFFSASMDNRGLSKLLSALNPYPQNAILIAMESSGLYHIPLFASLSARNFKTLLLNPLLISNYSKLSLRKTKTDKKDTFAIASFLLNYHKLLYKKLRSQPLQQLKELTRERENITSQIAKLKNDIEKLLAVTFPELPQHINPFSKSILNLLCSYPSSHAIKNCPIETINSFLNPTKGRNPLISAQKIVSLAKNSIAPQNKAKEFILSQKISTLIFFSKKLNEIDTIIYELAQRLIADELKILTSVKGIGKVTAIQFLAEIGSISYFESPKKLIAFMGIDPTVYESGQFKGKSRLSKRGNKHLRRIIWLMAHKIVRFNSIFKKYFQKRLSQGLPFKKAIFAVAHKLVRVLYALLTKKMFFNPTHSL